MYLSTEKKVAPKLDYCCIFFLKCPKKKMPNKWKFNQSGHPVFPETDCCSWLIIDEPKTFDSAAFETVLKQLDSMLIKNIFLLMKLCKKLLARLQEITVSKFRSFCWAELN
jgi:hypothetical protein